MLLPELSGLAFIASPDIPLHVLLQSWPPEATRQMPFYPKHSLMAQLVMRCCNQSSPLCFLGYQPMMPILALLPQFWSNNEKFQCIPDQILKLALCLTILLRKLNRIVMPTPMTSPRPRRSRLDPIPPNEPLDHETRHTWNPRSARDTCVPHEDSPFWTPRPKNVPKDDAHRHTPRTCIEARNVYLNSLYFLSLISPIFHVQHSFPCI